MLTRIVNFPYQSAQISHILPKRSIFSLQRYKTWIWWIVFWKHPIILNSGLLVNNTPFLVCRNIFKFGPTILMLFRFDFGKLLNYLGVFYTYFNFTSFRRWLSPINLTISPICLFKHNLLVLSNLCHFGFQTFFQLFKGQLPQWFAFNFSIAIFS